MLLPIFCLSPVFHFPDHVGGQECAAVIGCAREDQLLSGTGHCDVQDPAFLLDFIIAAGFDVREDSVLHTEQIGIVAFAPFGAVHGDQRDLPFSVLVLFQDLRVLGEGKLPGEE